MSHPGDQACKSFTQVVHRLHLDDLPSYYDRHCHWQMLLGFLSPSSLSSFKVAPLWVFSKSGVVGVVCVVVWMTWACAPEQHWFLEWLAPSESSLLTHLNISKQVLWHLLLMLSWHFRFLPHCTEGLLTNKVSPKNVKDVKTGPGKKKKKHFMLNSSVVCV